MTLSRRSPLPRKRAKPRRVRVRCSVRGCKRSPKVDTTSHALDGVTVDGIPLVAKPERLCLTHAKREADRLFSLAVRADGACARCGATDDLQCAHVISRRYLGTRYVRTNAMPLCLRCHKWQTEHPLEGEDFLREAVGSLVYDELRRLALAFVGPVDYAAIIANGGVQP